MNSDNISIIDKFWLGVLIGCIIMALIWLIIDAHNCMEICNTYMQNHNCLCYGKKWIYLI